MVMSHFSVHLIETGPPLTSHPGVPPSGSAAGSGRLRGAAPVRGHRALERRDGGAQPTLRHQIPGRRLGHGLMELIEDNIVG